MDQNKVSRLVVIDKNGIVIGLISTNLLLSNSDFFTKNILNSTDYLVPSNDNVTVSDLLDENLVTINENEDLVKAASLMIKYKISGIPVLDSKEKLIGVISKTDIVKAFSLVAAHEKLKLKYKEMY